MKIIRHVVGNLGIYAAVEKDCPRDDMRRHNKPDGSWLPRVGLKYPGAISFWKVAGLNRYVESGLFAWHQSVVIGTVVEVQLTMADLEVLYEDEFQVIGRIKKTKL